MNDVLTFAKLAPQLVVALVILLAIGAGVLFIVKVVKQFGVNGEFEKHCQEDRDNFESMHEHLKRDTAALNIKIDRTSKMLTELHNKFIRKEAYDAGKEAGETGRHEAQNP